MPQLPNSYAKQPTQQKEFYDRALLGRLKPKLYFAQFGQTDKRTIPKNEGDTINLRRFHKYPPATEPLIEGVTPAGKTFDVTTIRATVDHYGDFTKTTDLISLMGIDPVVTELTEIHGDQAGETIDIVVRDVVASGTNVLYLTPEAVKRGDVAEGSNFDGTAARRIRQIMARNNVDKLGKDFVCFVHPDTVYDLQGSEGWEKAALYAGSTQIFNGEAGRLWGIRFIETTNAPIYVGEGKDGADVYCSIAIGKGAYGMVDIAGSSKPEVIIKPLGSAGADDPLNQRASIGWKALFTAVRLQELAILRVEHTISL
ncbi:MAG: N4-gp56 family major capsid protein [Bacteroidales bacterium]|nr:N4-gp56 family major capsid protein [Bacteroidales bacterium]